MITIIYKRNKKFTIKKTINENPTPGSFGDYLLMKDDLMHQDEDWADRKPESYKQMVFNYEWLQEMEVKHLELHCEYCNKQMLRIFHWKEKAIHRIMATVDHFLPIKNYPNLAKVKTNFRVACNNCNSKKDINIWECSFPYPEHKI